MNHFVWRRDRKKKRGPAVREITWRCPSMKMLDVLSLHATVRATLDSQYRGFSNNVGEKSMDNISQKCPQLARNCQVSEQFWIPKIEVLVLAKRAFINSSASM